MSKTKLTAWLLAGVMCAAFAPAVASAQAPARSAYKAPRTLGTLPDLQGTWTNASLTRSDRPAQYGDRLHMTDEEARALEGTNLANMQKGNQPTAANATVADVNQSCATGAGGAGAGVNCAYNTGWIDPGSTVMRVGGKPRTSFITFPATGRAPTPRADARPAPRQAAGEGATGGDRPGQNDNPETRTLADRCLTSFGNSAGPVMLPLLYNNNYQIVQSKDAVVIVVEMVHDARVVRLNSRHRTDGVRPWYGDSIGWYEGDTLVIETVGYHPSQQFRGYPTTDLKVTERLTRVAKDRLLYEFKVENPTVWDTAWGGEYEFGASEGNLYEYACHEGNYAMEGILAGARNDERLASQGARPAGTQ
jgi:hypothetical protein